MDKTGLVSVHPPMENWAGCWNYGADVQLASWVVQNDFGW